MSVTATSIKVVELDHGTESFESLANIGKFFTYKKIKFSSFFLHHFDI